ncbi:hypothetical protein Ctob_000024, partial [Chrysochromulina tobinii]
MVMQAEQKIVDGDGGKSIGATVAEDDPFAIAALREPVAPPPLEPPPLEPPPKKSLLNLFGTRKPTVSVPTVDDLTMASTPQAALCKTLAWSLRAPIDIAAASTPEEGTELNLDEDGPAALAISILEELDAAKNETIGAGLSLREVGSCLEQVGRAMLLQRVDAAIAVLNQPEAFAEQAKFLCLFAQNAEAVATFMGVERLVGEVLYEGAEGRRPLERLYAGCLRLAAPELLASMGMGLGGEDGEGAASTGVGLDTVEKLRPLLKVSDQKGEKLVQEVMQQQMMAAMGPTAEGDETKQIAQSVAMLETLIDSGSMQPEDLASLKGMISQSMGMPVEELLRRKDELQQGLPEEGKKLFTLLERLFGDGAKTKGAKTGGAGGKSDKLKSAGAGKGAADLPDDLEDDMKVT